MERCAALAWSKWRNSWPGSSAYGCKAPRACGEGVVRPAGSWGQALAAIALLLIDRQQILRSKGTNGPVKMAGLSGW